MTEQLAIDIRTGTGRKSRANRGMTEAQLLAAVRTLAKYRGWMTYHTAYSRGSEAGWPDLVLMHPKQRRTLFVELKSPTGKLSASQELWLGVLAGLGHETGVWRPNDLPTVIPAVLAGRRTCWKTATLEEGE